jgi:hypothetical protein
MARLAKESRAGARERQIENLERGLSAYTLAATAAGVGLLMLVPAANAEVVYTPATFTITFGSRLLDLNGDGVSDFIVLDQFHHVADPSIHGSHSGIFIGQRKLRIGGESVGGGVESSHNGAAVLASGATIGSSQPFLDVEQKPALMVGGASYAIGSTGTCCFFPSGNWQNLKQKYLGLRFTINGETHYGWARFNVKLPDIVTGPITARLTGFAYETNPDQSITAGDEGPNSVGLRSPQPGTLGALALGTAAK